MHWAGATEAIRPVRDGWERIADFIDRVKWETDLAVSEKRQRWNRSVRAKGKVGEGSPKDGARVQRDGIPVGVPQETSVVVIDDSISPASKVAASAANVRSVHVTGDAGSPR